MKKNYLLFVFTYFIIFASSCVKEGPAGPAGKDGKDGNANVKTEIIKVFSNDWDYSNSIYSVIKSPEILTEEIVDKGSVHLYFEIGDKKWLALPLGNIGFGFGVKELSIFTQAENVVNSTSIFKLVVIDGSIHGMVKINFNNYAEVKEYFNLAD